MSATSTGPTGDDRPADHSAAYELWKRADGETDAFDKDEYRRLLVEHALIPPVRPGGLAGPLPVGWPEVRYTDDFQWLETAHMTHAERVEHLGPKPWKAPTLDEREER